MSYNLITILGHTAGGKTALASHLALKLGGEIISADSRQVYRQMDLGTGKDLQDYTLNGIDIPYHLINIADPGYKYNVFEFQRDFIPVFKDIVSRGKMPVMCGGTGMYLDAVLKGYKLIQVPDNPGLRQKLETFSLDELKEMLSRYKKLHNVTDVDTKKRAIRAIEIEEYYLHNPEIEIDYPEINSLNIGIVYNRIERRERITRRLRERLQSGMIEETEQILASGVSPDDLIYYGLEYKYLTLFVTGKLTYDEMFSQLETAIHQFAKRQMTWFRGMERKGTKIHWIDGSLSLDKKLEISIKLISNTP
ncbi:MAG: tRNA (adenosine(37)-N6)-dimethylallyltransferase MiaA [Bacteroidetes bacterium GWF2_38_335]|nr:MAG: tRNA (adenosine(37)-N6)-dimethylallyltransferase MiaA [Bacteroidetes bacterium GWF2_38_335]OFY78784.1 MAG: tRNA (adenosine(37)-N6)-dimethylallyltransferase MiaA [Bacteroidetes bacterium RIFOXYA12_FULL_38_20]HBS85178.1 tRNA (adenosine(37)-N6)-dimethylallyltransferase MiaA [Bacteroidales bacterium]